MKNRDTRPILLLVFVSLAAGIVAAGWLLYRSQRDSCRTKSELTLTAIADLKVSELSVWRKERLVDVNTFYKNNAFSALVRRSIERPQDLPVQDELQSWLSRVQASACYDRIALFDAACKTLIVVSGRDERLSTLTQQKAREVLRSGQPTFADFYPNQYTKKIFLRVFVPILDGPAGSRPLGVLMLRIDPETYLDPFIQRWPTPSATAETLLIRREGNEAVFLNKLRFQKDTAPAPRISLGNTNVPAVKAALGRDGIVEGVDYRGVPVLATMRTVPDSPWFLVAKIDAAEVYAPMREWFWMTVLFVGALLFGVAAILGFLWRQQHAAIYREKYEADRKYGQVVSMISDIVWRHEVDGQGRFVSSYISPVADRLLGLPADTIGNSFDKYFSHVHPEDLSGVQELLSSVLGRRLKDVTAEYRIQKPDGTMRWFHSKGSAYAEPDGHSVAFGTTTDITERKRAEERDKVNEVRTKTLLELSQMTDCSAAEIAKHAMESAIELTGSTIGYLAFASEDETVLTMHYWSKGAMQECATTEKPIVYQVKDTGLWGEPIRQRKAIIMNDYAAPNPLKKGTPPGHVRLTRHMNIPVFDGGRIVAVAGVGNKSENYQDDDVRQLTLFMDGMWRILCRKRAEEALAESEDQLRLLLDSTAEAIYGVDLQGCCTFCNPACLRLVGCEHPDELLGKNMHEQIHHSRPDGNAYPMDECRIYQAFQKEEDTHADDEVFWRKNGTSFPAEYWSHPQWRNGKVVGAVVTFVDITERKQAEHRQARSLRRVEGVNRLQEDLLLPGSIDEKFKRITDAAVELLDLDFCRIWMIEPADLCDRDCVHAATEGPNACRHRDKCLHLRASSGRYTHTDGSHRRVPLGACKIGRIANGETNKFLTNSVTTDPQVGDHAWAKRLGLVSFAGYKLRDANGEPIGVLAKFAKHPVLEEDDAFMSNLAETTSRVILEHQAAEELQRTKNQAVEASRAKSRFLANMSHEIRTPMTAILGYADLLMDPTVSPSSRNNHLAVIRRSGEHLLSLINDILDLSKIEAGKFSLEIRRCSIVSLLADVTSMMRPRAEQRGVSLSVEYAGEMPETILTDGARLRQAIVNLVGNAVKFTDQGSVRIMASFVPQWSENQPAVRIEVIDTGIGIRQEVLPRLFQPFTQGDASISQTFGGTGLGLAISRQIAYLLGGGLTVTSVLGQGSTFTLTVPTGSLEDIPMLGHPAEAMHENVGHELESPIANLKGIRILLAEDGYDNRKLIETILRLAGANVASVENGRLAVDKLEAESFDVVLMDINMPEMDGYEATRLLRDRGYDKPILALTANAMEGDSERCLAAGCDEHLAKPIDRVRLLRTIAEHVGKRTTESENGPAPAAQAPREDGVIISQFADDPEIATILEEFVGRLEGQADAMRRAYADSRYEDLQRCAHRLKGAGGSYGYPSLTDANKRLEDAAKVQDRTAAGAALDEVAQLIRAIENGYSAETLTGRT